MPSEIRRTIVATVLNTLTPILAGLVFAGIASAQSNAQAQACPATGQEMQERIDCVCTALAVEAETAVWGTDIYTDDSNVCRAARHAGAVTAGGGVVQVTPQPGRQSYPGSERNGVTSADYAEWGRSFSVATSTAEAAIDLRQCPGSFQGLHGRAAIVECTCSAAQTTEGAVWGTDVYTDDSAICQAARHAGVIAGSGGLVRLQSVPAPKGYAGSQRNGVTSQDYGEWERAFGFAR